MKDHMGSTDNYLMGPASAWPVESQDELIPAGAKPPTRTTKVQASPTQMARGLVTTAFQAVTHGAVSPEIRNLRYATCESCPSFIHQSKRCSECGCFMEAKTWMNGNKDQLCPLKKWAR